MDSRAQSTLHPRVHSLQSSVADSCRRASTAIHPQSHIPPATPVDPAYSASHVSASLSFILHSVNLFVLSTSREHPVHSFFVIVPGRLFICSSHSFIDSLFILSFSIYSAVYFCPGPRAAIHYSPAFVLCSTALRNSLPARLSIQRDLQSSCRLFYN